MAVACHAGGKLGRKNFRNSPNRAFLGFDTYLIHPSRSSSRANSAYESALSGLFSGATLQDVETDLRAHLLQAAQDYKTNRSMYKLSRGDAIAIFGGLRSNVLALVCYGDTQKTSGPISSLWSEAPPDALVALRLMLDREILRFAQLASSPDERRTDNPESLLWLLASKGVIKENAASVLSDYILLTEKYLRMHVLPDREGMPRVLGIGNALLTRLHRTYLIERLAHDMQAHTIWPRHPRGTDNRRLHWAAIASEAPSFDFSYEILIGAIFRRAKTAAHGRIIQLPTMRDFIAILEFRQSELRRIWEIERGPISRKQDGDRNWRWPVAWDIPWNGPIAAHSLWEIEEQLFLTSKAIERYRQRLATSKATTLDQIEAFPPPGQ